MQRVDIEINQDNFFCPVTGVHILSAEDFNPSPALKFCFVEDSFAHITDDMKKILRGKDIDTTEDPLYLDWEDFETFINDLKSDDYVLFEITQSGIACGPVSMTSYFCIDMSYSED
jgi:hypothetical protein